MVRHGGLPLLGRATRPSVALRASYIAGAAVLALGLAVVLVSHRRQEVALLGAFSAGAPLPPPPPPPPPLPPPPPPFSVRLGDDVMDIGNTSPLITRATDDGDVHVDVADLPGYMFSKDADARSSKLKMKSHTQKVPVLKLQSLLAGYTPPAPSPPPSFLHLGDNVLDVGNTSPLITRPTDDGDVHADGSAVHGYMFSKNADARGSKLKTKPLKQRMQLIQQHLSKLSAADEAELAKCNVPPPRPAYCHLLQDIGMDVESVKIAMPKREDTEYRYKDNAGGHSTPLRQLVPVRMKHEHGADLGDNMVQFGAPDVMKPVEEQNEEPNLVPETDSPGPLGRMQDKGGPMSPVLRHGATPGEGALREQHPVGFHYSGYDEQIKSLDRETSDKVLYGALDDYKKLGLALSDEYVPSDADAKAREEEYGDHPGSFSERFSPLAEYASSAEWRKETNSTWLADDLDAIEQTEGNMTDIYGGRSGAEQSFLYGKDFLELGHPRSADDEGSEFGWGDVRMQGPGDGKAMPAFPRDTNAMVLHPWTDQGQLFSDSGTLNSVDIMDSTYAADLLGGSNSTEAAEGAEESAEGEDAE